jgi:regulatory protein
MPRRSRPETRGQLLDTEGVSVEEASRLAFGFALRALVRRPRTEAELRSVLTRRGCDADVIDATLGRLREVGYLDDAAVAEASVREAGRRGLGSRRVRHTLERRGVSGELSSEAERASAAGELERAQSLLRRRFPNGLGTDLRARARAFRLLLARGFPSSVARQAAGGEVEPTD